MIIEVVKGGYTQVVKFLLEYFNRVFMNFFELVLVLFEINILEVFFFVYRYMYIF